MKAQVTQQMANHLAHDAFSCRPQDQHAKTLVAFGLAEVVKETATEAFYKLTEAGKEAQKTGWYDVPEAKAEPEKKDLKTQAKGLFKKDKDDDDE